MQIWQKLGLIKKEGDLGIEVEVEGDSLPNRGLVYWRVEKDGSLRGESAEYVLREPLTVGAAEDAIAELEAAYRDHESVVHDSIRAGVHVHVNVQELEVQQLGSFITTYLILEEMLVKWCGKSREGNLFCLRCSDAEATLDKFCEAFRTRNYRMLFDDDIRYSSINLKALCEYGSVEFRSMRGTRELDKILLWAKMLKGLRDFAKEFETPLDVVDAFLLDPQKFLGEALADFCEDFWYDGCIAACNKGVRYANDFAHCSDWAKEKYKLVGGVAFPDHIEYPDEPLEDF